MTLQSQRGSRRFVPILLGFLGGLAGILVAATILNLPVAPAAAPDTAAPTRATAQGVAYPGDPDSEAALVAMETARLTQIRGLSAGLPWRIDGLEGPYRLAVGPAATVVLPARTAPYTLTDLTTAVPEAVTVQPDGSYLFAEDVVILAGATLALGGRDPLDLRLESGDSFASVVGLGGSLVIAGSAAAPVSITSWNSALGGPDQETSDGRAYLRMIGGMTTVTHARLSQLGFWSGGTGGFAVTGRAALDDSDAAIAAGPGEDLVTVDPPNPPYVTPGAGGAPLISASDLYAPDPSGLAQETTDIATANIDHVQANGNAYGLFVTNAEQVRIADTRIIDSLVDGLALHRHVDDATVLRTESSSNAVNGFSLESSTTGAVFDRVTASRNGANGVSLDGEPLAEGPSAQGAPVDPFGGNLVTDSTIDDNRRYGVEINGGRWLSVVSTRIAGNEIGIVVGEGATGVKITGNTLTEHVGQSIAIRDDVTQARLEENAISGGHTGIYVRNAGATVADNTISAVSSHGVSLVGDADDVSVTDNTIGGSGTTAVWTDTAVGGVITGNDLEGWQPLTTPGSVLRTVFQPLTIVWLGLGALLLVTALTRRGPQFGSIRHPYADQAPLTSLSRGIVSRDTPKGAE